MEIKRFDVFWVSLDPTMGSEMSKSKPAVIISPDEMNSSLKTVIVAPITSACKNYPTRIEISLQKVFGQIALDQIRTVDKILLQKRLTQLDDTSSKQLLDLLQIMFSK